MDKNIEIGWALTDKGVEKLSRECYKDDYGSITYEWKNLTRGFTYNYCDYNLFDLFKFKKDLLQSVKSKTSRCPTCDK
jgi:hypothetical protein